MSTAPFDADRIRSRLHPTRVGVEVRVFEELNSTNQYVLSEAPGEDGLVVLAERQSRGRGRHGRTWDCPRGAGILCTVEIIDTTNQFDAPLLSLVVPAVLCEAVVDATGVRCEIKWPNDLITGGRKLGGVLIEARSSGMGCVQYAIGFGINCLQQPSHFDETLRDRATSLDIESSAAIDRTDVLVRILGLLDRALTRRLPLCADDVCHRWKQHALALGGRVVLVHDDRRYTGHVVDIDPTAALVVQLDQGGRRLFPAAATTVLEYTT